jgi:hypothetical protein
MTDKKFKKPSQKKGQSIRDRETEANTDSIEYPVFGFKYINKELHPNRIDAEKQRAFIDKLCKLSQIKWNQIVSSGRHGLGTEKIRQEALSFSLPAHIKSDVSISSLKYSSMLSMVGYRSGNVFHILAVDIDFDHSCYQH